MVACYRIDGFTVSESGDDLTVEVATYSRAAWMTNVKSLLALVATQVTQVMPDPEVAMFSFTRATTYRVHGAKADDVESLLKAHSRPVLTAMTDCCAVGLPRFP